MKRFVVIAMLLASGTVAFSNAQAESVARTETAREVELLIRSQQHARAAEILKEQIDREPENLGANFLYATIMIMQNRYQDAIAIFEHLMTVKSDDYRVLNNYAWFLATATDKTYRDPPRALALAQTAILKAPNVHNVWNTLAEAHYINGNFDRAVRVLQQALEAALRENAPRATLQNYQQQLQRMQRAATIMSLVE